MEKPPTVYQPQNVFMPALSAPAAAVALSIAVYRRIAR